MLNAAERPRIGLGLGGCHAHVRRIPSRQLQPGLWTVLCVLRAEAPVCNPPPSRPAPSAPPPYFPRSERKTHPNCTSVSRSAPRYGFEVRNPPPGGGGTPLPTVGRRYHPRAHPPSTFRGDALGRRDGAPLRNPRDAFPALAPRRCTLARLHARRAQNALRSPPRSTTTRNRRA